MAHRALRARSLPLSFPRSGASDPATQRVPSGRGARSGWGYLPSMRASKLRLVIAVTGTLFGAELAAACGGAEDPQPSPPQTSSSPTTVASSETGGDAAAPTPKTPPPATTGTGAHYW